MNALLDRVFGLDGLGFGDPGVELSFAHALPAWVWALVLISAVALGAWSYSRLMGPPGVRAALAATRSLIVVLLALIVAGPRLIRPNERIEKDWVAVLADRSASMQVADVDAPGGRRQSRDEQLVNAVRASWPMWSGLSVERRVAWLGFDAVVRELRVVPGTDAGAMGVELGRPDGLRTALGRALAETSDRLAARPVAGIVVLSDGRSSDAVDRRVVRRLSDARVPVFVVPMGSAQPMADLSVSVRQAPRQAFVDDTVTVIAEVERLGGDGAGPGGFVELVDELSGRVLDRAPLTDSPRVALRHRPASPGATRWSVRLALETPDLEAGNNAASLDLDLVDRPIRVLYIDGYPRWEYRYVKNLMLREPSVRVSCLLLASSKRYIQEGDEIITTLPSSPEDWAEYDVVVLGDFRPGLLTEAQLEQLRDHVSIRGAGLLWIAGAGPTPQGWHATPLADLLPISVSTPIPVWDEPIVMHRAEPAEALGLVDLSDEPGEPARIGDPATGWSRLWWAQRIEPDRLKPAAEVLAFATPAGAMSNVRMTERSTPLVMSMRFGAGRVIYVGTDETWRWRYGRGEDLPERFWLPLIRLQGRERLAASGRGAVLEASPARAVVDSPVHLEIRLTDQSLIDESSGPVRVRVTREGDATSQTVVLTPRDMTARGASWVPTMPGRYTVTPAEGYLLGQGLSASVEVLAPDDERRHPQADHAALAELAAATGGRVVPPEALSELESMLESRQVVIASTPEQRTLWDRPIVLVVLMMLLTGEWVGRKLLRLA